MTDTFQLVTRDDLQPDAVRDFFHTAFGRVKGQFLTDHAQWHYNDSPAQYFVIAEDGSIVAFNALIESSVVINGDVKACLWLVDIIVLPDYRGKGLQRLMDEAVRDLDRVRLGFPNEVASKIHRKHGWGVRQDAVKLTLPLSMRVSNRVRLSQKVVGQFARAISAIVSPLIVGVFGLRYSSFTSKYTKRLPDLDAALFAKIFDNYQSKKTQLTTYRSQQYFEWRYGAAPIDFQYYVASENGEAKLGVVTQTLIHKGLQTFRIMDVFGAIEREDILLDALKTVLSDVVQGRYEQVQVIASDVTIITVLEQLGFWMRAPIDFCWYSQNDSIMSKIDSSSTSWVFADSDFAAP